MNLYKIHLFYISVPWNRMTCKNELIKKVSNYTFKTMVTCTKMNVIFLTSDI